MAAPARDYTPSKEAKDLYEKHAVQSWTDQQASSDAFDNNLLTFSSAALGLSLAFIKDIVPSGAVEWLGTLYASWIGFALCIVVTILSFQVAVQAQKAHQEKLRRYYLEGQEDVLRSKSVWEKAIPWLALSGAICFFMAIALTLTFAIHNMNFHKGVKHGG